MRPQNAQQLLEAFIAFGRERARVDGFLTGTDPYPRYMADTPQHAFTITPEDPSVVDVMGNSAPAIDWIRTRLIEPGQTIANQVMSAAQKAAFLTLIGTQLLPTELSGPFLAEARIKARADDRATIHQFSSQMQQLVLQLIHQDQPSMATSVAASLSTILLENILPDVAVQTLSQSAARIADTNWVDSGVRHIFFVCFFDPVTNQLQLGTLDEDGTSLRALDQSEWVYVPWELYGVKLTPS